MLGSESKLDALLIHPIELLGSKPAVSSAITHISHFVQFATILAVLGSVSYVLYNLYLHPLRDHPGPKLWAATPFPWTYYRYKGKLNNIVPKLHERYGTTVRLAPNFVSYVNEASWKTIYSHKPEMGKVLELNFQPANGIHGIITTPTLSDHGRQRSILAHAFSEKALREQEPLIQDYLQTFVERVTAQAKVGKVDLVKWYNYITFDIISDLAFGHAIGCLENGRPGRFIDNIYGNFRYMNETSSLWMMGLKWLAPYITDKSDLAHRLDNLKYNKETVERRLALGDNVEHPDFFKYIIKANNTDKAMSHAEMVSNAGILFGAGSETTATTLAATTWMLTQNPEVYQKLVAEIRGKFSSADEINLISVNQCEYMLGVLNEGMRLFPPVPQALPRTVPIGGETIDGRFVPEGTMVGVDFHAANTYSGNWYKPNKVIPERWMASTRNNGPWANDHREALQPFSYGPRNCLGRNLGYAEMRLILARTIFEFDIEATGMEDWKDSALVRVLWMKNPLPCKMTPVVR